MENDVTRSTKAITSLLDEAVYINNNCIELFKLIGKTNYSCQEKIIIDLFSNAPLNANYNIVYHKVSLLNLYYSTQIWNITPIVDNIIKNHNIIDNVLPKGSISVVNLIANFTSPKRKNLSFASKYCAAHYPDAFPIYDKVVRLYLAKVISKGNLNGYHGCYSETDKKLHDYSYYVEVYNAFRKQYNLSSLTYKEIDKYIWISHKCKSQLQHLDLFKLLISK